MASLSETISLLTNPAPKVLDPEDDDIDAAKITKHNDDTEEMLFERSELRSRSAVLLDDYLDYGGKKVSRKSLSRFFHDDEKSLPKQDVKDLAGFVHKDLDYDESKIHDDDDDLDVEEDDDEDEELSDADLEIFKTSIKKQSLPSDEENVESIEDEDSEESEVSDAESNEDLTNKFSNIDVTNEMEKGAAVKAQQELWHRLCEARIKLQKLLIITNKLPQSDCWSFLKKNFDKDMLQCLTKGSNSVKFLLNNCLDLQTEMLKRIPEINNNDSMSHENEKASDEEIPSESEEENQVEGQKQKKQETVKKMLKRKLKCDEYGEMVAKHHKSLLPYRNSVIQKWDEKTKLSSGRITQKSFSTFESSALKQIEQILQDESRLIKRTQLKRSLYRILGKPDDSDIKSKENTEKESMSKQDMLLRDYDTEIFDDDDFYRQLLKDIIESKSVGIDPVVLRKQMEIQSIRNKIKKKVDTKASKGRKIRYDVHPKLVGFMKKQETCTLPDDARDNLLKCMFGKGSIGS